MAQVLTNAGRTLVQNRLNGTGTAPIYLAQGTGAGTSAATDVALFTEVLPRVAGTPSIVTVNVTSDTYQLTGTMTVASPEGVTNAGIFDASTSGDLFLHADFSIVNLAAGDGITYTWRWTLS